MVGQPSKSSARVDQSTPQRHPEIETKLDLPADVPLPRLTNRKQLVAVGLPGVGPDISYELDATYYDTAGLDLLRSRLTLRRRTGGEDAGWHLKLPDVGRGRTEVTLPLDVQDDHRVPEALADLVRGAARGRDLVPVARLHNHRVVRHLLDDAGERRIEVADDTVTATPLQPGGGESQTWRELEAEVVGGDAEQLAATVAVLRSAGATPAAGPSKLGRALPLPPRETGLPRKSAGATLLSALDRQRAALLTVDRRLRESDRTAVADGRRIQRRIRSILRVFGPLFDSEVAAAVRGGLRDLGESLARSREVDVLRARLHGQLIEEPDEYARQARLRLDAELDDRASRAWSRIVGFLDGEGYLATLRALDGLLDGPSVTRRAHRAAATELPPLLDRSWGKLRSLADAALADPDHAPTVHETRKATKTLRYATEATVSALGDNAVLLAAGLEDVQEVLGEHRDSILAAEMLVELARDQNTDGVAGFIFGRLHAVEQALAHGAIDDFADAWDRIEDGDLVAALSR
jgi:CHAD domain-containing protein